MRENPFRVKGSVVWVRGDDGEMRGFGEITDAGLMMHPGGLANCPPDALATDLRDAIKEAKTK